MDLDALKVAPKITYKENSDGDLKFFVTSTFDLDLSKYNGQF